ncbi:hypothetical protein V6N12_014467 [Hibiscus sabdariffa]|uniref:Benzyl alcohol O-benzoyltransferase n=1 Tax=Hibiscus sabdariffa TaxID=183260 RepID=A0ABR2DK88_9ROSI
MPGVHFYRQNSSMEGKDPAKVIREALGQVLVFYYPFAGRLREAPNGKLMVDCNAEGVLFIEADADVTLEDFGDATCLPFPCFEELLYDVPGSNGLLNCPSLLIQFMHAMAEIARGALTPSIQPVWERHLLSVRDPPFITCVHHAYNDALIEEVDFGWGKAACMVPAEALEFVNFYIPYEDGILVPISLAAPVMEIFVKEMHGLLNFRDETTGVC